MLAALPLAVGAQRRPGACVEVRRAGVLNAVRIARPVGGPKQRPRRVAGHKGYSHPAIRRWLRRRLVGAVIPERRDRGAHRRGCPAAFDHAEYRRRNGIERCVGWLNEARGAATRLEKLAARYLGVPKLAMLLRHLQLTLSNTP